MVASKGHVSGTFSPWENGYMCGRFVQAHDAAFYADAFAVETIRTETLPVSYNVAPTDHVYAVAEHQGTRVLTSFRWGLIPWWAKDRKIGARHINARAETVADKPAFRDSLAARRCLIPADGFFEWQRKPKGKLPHYIHGTEGRPLAFAGLWSSWRDPESEEKVLTCTIITGSPNDKVKDIHNRMPVIMGPDDWALWLDRTVDDPLVLEGLLKVHSGEGMAIHPVSTLVNNVRNNYPECIQPLETGAAES
jgi:putative SOS response-associated peptidase YedK